MIYSSSLVLCQNTKYKPVIVTSEYACFDASAIKAARKALNDGQVYKMLDSLNNQKIDSLSEVIIEKQNIINRQFSTINTQTTRLQNEEFVSENLKKQLNITLDNCKILRRKSFWKGIKYGIPSGVILVFVLKNAVSWVY